ncbi:FG-GAP-like repeat-containing protein [Streptomyces sp. SHP 1-2]|uniref:FG-GAP-like repeat-containing protein n=1 Tax=Streptomyces sp. SHP 1-2 TaxID=2769489 RepID=UPI00223824AD|nr:FG-GAP-like repeat-containing protein [Streptomyces sp. SHP 1-2]MCW5249818.1 peptidoglycan DD-metalloendopeptidase family protein [Streptomyces sp. SHP 1-2]
MRRRTAAALALLLACPGGLLSAGAASAAPGAPFRLPYPAGSAYTITQTPGSGYSHNDAYNRHAVDFALPSGTPVVASAAGTVRFEGWSAGGGIMALIDHGGNRCSQYAHLGSTIVDAGNTVALGQRIGTSGATGNATGPHLHWNIVYCDSQLSREIPDSVETGTSYPTGYAPVSRNGGQVLRPDGERVSDFSGDGAADVLGVDANGDLLYYPNNGYRLSPPTRIGHGWGSFKHIMAADFSGDGAADILGVDANGDLLYYPNNGYRLSPPTRIGHGWGSFKHIMAADFSGDGKADVLGVDATGNLLYYPHNGNGLSAPVRIGHGWGSFQHVMAADFSGDGKADVLGVDASGNLLHYPHVGSGLGSPVRIGTGWGAFPHVMASDFSGDGKADVLGVDTTGNLLYYPHNGNGLSAPVRIGHGWGTFRFVL